MRRTMLAAIAAFVTATSSLAEVDPHMSDVQVDWTNLPEESEYHGRRSLGIFLWACDGIDLYRFEIADFDAEVTTLDADDPLHEKYGWDKVIRVRIRMADSGRLPADWGVRGETFEYTLGGGETPGIYGATETSRALCENKKPYRPTDWDWFNDSYYLREIDKI